MKLAEVTKQIRADGDKAVVPFFTAGYPDRETFRQLLAAAAQAGCKVVEIGVPFSDPIADGPVIQASSQVALAGGMTLGDALALADEAAREHGLTLVLMGYINPLLHMGLEHFADRAREAGVGGVIVADAPVEEMAGVRAILAERGITLVDLVAPTSGVERIGRIASQAEGFLYLVSVTGVTGTGADITRDLGTYVGRVREHSGDLPLYVGFGVSNAEQARQVCAHADGVIIGSAIIRIVQEAAATEGASAAPAAVRAFLEGVAAALNQRSES